MKRLLILLMSLSAWSNAMGQSPNAGPCGCCEVRNSDGLCEAISSGLRVEPEDTSVCAGGEREFAAFVGSSPVSVNWAVSATCSAGGFVDPDYCSHTTTYVPDNAGYCFINADCGSVQASGAVTVNPNPTVSVNSPSACSGASATITAGVSGGTPSYNYAWTVPSGATNPGNVSSFSATVAGTYGVTVTDSAGCTATGSGTLTVNPLPNCDIAGKDVVCVDSYGHTYSGPPSMASYAWSIAGQGAISGSGSGQSVLVDAGTMSSSSFTLTLVVTGANGCINTCDKTVGLAKVTGITRIAPGAAVECVGSQRQFQVTTSPPGNYGPVELSLDPPGDGTVSWSTVTGIATVNFTRGSTDTKVVATCGSSEESISTAVVEVGDIGNDLGCTKIPQGTYGLRLEVSPVPSNRTIKWYKDGVFTGTGNSYTLPTTLPLGDVVFKACDDTLPGCCSPELTITITSSGGGCLGNVAFHDPVGSSGSGTAADCAAADDKGYLAFDNTPIDATVCWDITSWRWRLHVTDVTLKYKELSCFSASIPIESGSDWSAVPTSQLCEIVDDLDGDWTTYFPTECFTAFCLAGANEFAPFFKARVQAAIPSIEAVPIAFNCDTAYDATSAAQALLANQTVVDLINRAIEQALGDWNANFPAPTQAMRTARNSCIEALIKSMCDYLEGLTPPVSCASCPP